MGEGRRVAVITGAAQGIGACTAQVLAERGYDLVLNDLRAPSQTASAARGVGAKVMEAVGDVCDEAFIKLTVQQTSDAFGRVDVLVNNAGIAMIQPAEKTTAAEWRRMLDVNLLGPFLLCKAFGEIMLRQRSGSIINIASIAGLYGFADRSAYVASKHGLIGLTRTLAAEWGGRGVRCNAVCPGWVKTEMDVASQASGFYSDDDITNRVPMGRFASPGDIANAIAFLADPKLSGFVNGLELRVDGGWTADAGWDKLRRDHR
jgi:NAD(P)-dependent dehydrogenase (short-subunit alcohol dehydrogenase family)